MTCQDALAYVGPYLDGELTVSETASVDAHVATCAACTRLVERQRAWTGVVQQAPRFRAPETLAQRVRAAVERADVIPAPAVPASAPSGTTRGPSWTSWLVAAAAVVLCATVTLGIWTIRQRAADADLIAHDVIAGHIRSLMAAHLTDVPSSDRHTVKPWFGGKVPYALTVPDLTARGFTLDGGRLDYIGGRVAAALVYRRNQHVINLFVWPIVSGDRPENESRTSLGYEAIAWTARGQQFWAVSDLNDAELRQFVAAIQQE